MSATKADLETIRLFAMVALKKNFRQAAGELGVPVATLSRKISKLEEKLGTQLLQRTTRSVILTETGEQFLKDVNEPLQRLDRATRRAAHQQDATSGLVRIATTYTLAQTNILPVLPKLRARWPNIRVQLMLSENVVDIRSKRIDFAVRAGKLTDLSLIARKLCTHRFIRYSTPQMQDSGFGDLVAYSKDFFGEQTAGVEVKDMRMILRLVLANLGEAWMPDALCIKHERQGKLVRVEKSQAFAIDVFLVFGSKKFLPKRVRLVMDAIVEHANEFTREIQNRKFHAD